MQSSAANLDETGLAPMVALQPGDEEPRRAGAGLIRRVLALAWPVLALNSLVLLVELSDRFLVGNLADVDADSSRSMLAAVATAHYIAWFISSYTVLVSVGATALVARSVGARDFGTATRATHQAIWLGILVGAAGSLIALANLSGFVWLLGLDGAAAEYAATYLRPMFWLLMFRVVEMAGVACLIGAGDTRTGLWVQGGVAALNIPLAWVLCRGIGTWEGLGFIGVPLGTALSYFAGAAAVLVVLARGRAGLKFRLAEFFPEWPLMKRLLRVSVPAAADSLSVVAGQMWFLHIVNGLGTPAAAAHGIALAWEALGYLSGHAFGTAAMTLVGQNLGAQLPDRAARAGWTAFALGCGLMSVMGILFFTLAPWLFAPFCRQPGQEVIVEAGVPVLRLVAFAMPALASTMIFTAALRGAGDTRIPVLFTWIGFLAVRIPLAYTLTSPPFELGLFGAWLAMAADLFVRGGFFWWRFAGGRWKQAVV
jgi:putative MATE family efflux protein